MISDKLSFAAYLKEVHGILNREIVFKTASFEELINIKMDELDHNFCPALVLAISQAFDKNGRESIALATVVQYIFMADKVHRLMREKEITEAERQFPILVGDFLFGRFFMGLAKNNILYFLAPLAKAISIMNQGKISRKIAGENLESDKHLQILGMERASLTAAAARLSAELAGASIQLQEKYEALGWQLGLIWAADNDKVEKHVLLNLKAKAQSLLNNLQEQMSHPLNELYDYLSSNLAY